MKRDFGRFLKRSFFVVPLTKILWFLLKFWPVTNQWGRWEWQKSPSKTKVLEAVYPEKTEFFFNDQLTRQDLGTESLITQKSFDKRKIIRKFWLGWGHYLCMAPDCVVKKCRILLDPSVLLMDGKFAGPCREVGIKCWIHLNGPRKYFKNFFCSSAVSCTQKQRVLSDLSLNCWLFTVQEIIVVVC